MIVFMTGSVGTGKTLLLVSHLLNYCRHTAVGGYRAKEGICIVSNIDGLVIPHERLVDVVDAAGGYDKFFTVSNINMFLKSLNNRKNIKGIVFAIDEFQGIYNIRMPVEVRDFFWRHRHIGVDESFEYGGIEFICATPSLLAVPSVMRGIVEIEYKAVPPARSFWKGEARYDLCCAGKKMTSDRMKHKRKLIYQLYKSSSGAHAPRHSPVRNKIMFMLVIVFLLLSFCFWGLSKPFEYFNDKVAFRGGKGDKAASESDNKVASPVRWVWVVRPHYKIGSEIRVYDAELGEFVDLFSESMIGCSYRKNRVRCKVRVEVEEDKNAGQKKMLHKNSQNVFESD